MPEQMTYDISDPVKLTSAVLPKAPRNFRKNKSVFATFEDKAWPHVYDVTLVIDMIAGGVPNDPKVAEGWIKSKGAAPDELIREAVAETMAKMKVSQEEAIDTVTKMKTLNGFKRQQCVDCPEDGLCNGEHYLIVEGRQVKAMLKEGCSVAFAGGRLLNNGKNSWGRTSKGIIGFAAEHLCVVEDEISLGVTQPRRINQSFVHTFRGSSIQYEEIVTEPEVHFTLKTDYEFTEHQWAMIWLTAQEEGLGASRSQGFGRFVVTGWEKR